jgi:cold shock CspA family protein
MRYQGRVKKFLSDRAFGFVECPELPGDTFVHVRDLPPGMKGLEVGQKVEFELGPDRKGGSRQRAVAVTLV